MVKMMVTVMVTVILIVIVILTVSFLSPTGDEMRYWVCQRVKEHTTPTNIRNVTQVGCTTL